MGQIRTIQPEAAFAGTERAAGAQAGAFERALSGADRAGRRAGADALLARSGFTTLARIVDFAALLLVALAGLASSATGALWSAPLAAALPWLAAPALVSGLLQALGVYAFLRPAGLFGHLSRVAAGFALAAAPAAALLALSGAPARAIVLAGGAAAAALIALHAAWRLAAARLARRGALKTKVVIVGATPSARALVEANAEAGELEVLGVFDDRAAGRAPDSVAGAPVVGTLDELVTWARLPEADKIIIAVTSRAEDRVRELVARLGVLPQRIALSLDAPGADPRRTTLARLADAPVAYVSGAPDRPARRFAKRIQDLVLGSLALVLAAPAMILIALLIKLDSKGPVLFRQFRHGFNNAIIEVVKFRTMGAEETGRPTRQVVENDPRVTRIGRFLRKTSLDELPQLINVLRGDMSLVGPRPHAIDMKTGEVESHRLVAEYAHRHRVKPGITGWAAIRGSRGPMHTPEAVRRRVALDLEYVERQGFWFDLYILAMTLPCLLGDRLAPR